MAVLEKQLLTSVLHNKTSAIESNFYMAYTDHIVGSTYFYVHKVDFLRRRYRLTVAKTVGYSDLSGRHIKLQIVTGCGTSGLNQAYVT